MFTRHNIQARLEMRRKEGGGERENRNLNFLLNQSTRGLAEVISDGWKGGIGEELSVLNKQAIPLLFAQF